MSRNAALLDIYFHMANHYKKLKCVKSVVDTSPPTGYDKSQSFGRSRPTSRPESRASSARLTTANSSERLATFRKDGPKVCPTARSHSLPARPITWRKPIDMPYMYQISTSKHRTPTPKKSKLTKADSPKLLAGQEIHCDNGTIKPTPAPRKKADISHNRKLSEHAYLRFSLRIMEDIIRNNLLTNKQMREVFKSHVEANHGCLDSERMLQQINYLKLELGIPESDNDDDCQEYTNQPQHAHRLIVQENSYLNCECSVIRQLPYSCPLTETKPEEAEYESSCIEQLTQEEEIIRQAELDQASSESGPTNQPSLSSVLEQTEPTNSVETLITNKINHSKSHEDDLVKKDTLDIINKEIASIPSGTNVIFNNFVTVEQPIQLSDFHEEVAVQFGKDLMEFKGEVYNKSLVLSDSANFKFIDPSDITDDYILIPGPIYIPKIYLNANTTNELQNISIAIPTKSEKTRYLLLRKNIGINTEIMSPQSSIPFESEAVSSDKTEKKRLDKTCDIMSHDSENWLNIASIVRDDRLISVDLNCYDLTPQRDSDVSSHGKLKDNLLLGDEYAIKKELPVDPYNSSLPLGISQFYPSDATQTSSSDWLIPRKSTKSGNFNLAKPRESLLTSITPQDTNCPLSVSTTSNQTLLENYSSLKTPMANLNVSQEFKPALSDGKTRRKSSLKKRMDTSDASIGNSTHSDPPNRATFSEDSLLENERLKLQYRQSITRPSAISILNKYTDIAPAPDKIGKSENFMKQKKSVPSEEISDEEFGRSQVAVESIWEQLPLRTIKKIMEPWDEVVRKKGSNDSEEIQPYIEEFMLKQNRISMEECLKKNTLSNSDTNSDLQSLCCGMVKTRRKRPRPADTVQNNKDTAAGTSLHINGKGKEINKNSTRFFTDIPIDTNHLMITDNDPADSKNITDQFGSR